MVSSKRNHLILCRRRHWAVGVRVVLVSVCRCAEAGQREALAFGRLVPRVLVLQLLPVLREAGQPWLMAPEAH